MRRITLLCISLLFLLTEPGISQTNIDSLRNRLNDLPADTSKVQLLLKLVNYYRMRNMEDSLLSYTSQTIELSENLNYPEGKVSAILARGLIAHAKGRFEESKQSYREALALAKQIDLKKQLGAIYLNFGITFNRAGEYDSSFYYFTLAEKNFEANNQTTDLWRVYNGLALLYNTRGELGKAGNYYDKAFAAVKNSDNRMHKGYMIYQAAEFFFFTDNYTKYQEYAEYWHNFQSQKKATRDLIESPEHSALSFLFTDDDDATIRRLKNAIDYFWELGNLKRSAWCMTDLCRVYQKTDQTDKAIDVCLKAAEVFESIDEKLRLAEAKRLLYQAYEVKNNYKQALTHYRDYNNILNDLQSFEREQTLADLEIRYETDKKEQVLKIQQLELRQKTQQRNILLGSSLFLALLAGLIFVGLRQRLQTNKELAAQRQEIQAQKIHQLEQEKQLLAFSSMIEGQESERMRIAKDLHDGIGGLLTTAKAHFNAIQDQVKKLEELNLVHKTNELIDEACMEVRRISQNMMPRALMLYGLNGAIEDLATNLRQNNINCNLEIVGLEKEPEQPKSVMIFRILQELTNNILKHAQAKNVLIQLLEADGGLSVIVEDDGTGFNYEAARQKKSLGLSSVESRIQYLQGNLDYDAVPREGTTVAMWIPL